MNSIRYLIKQKFIPPGHEMMVKFLDGKAPYSSVSYRGWGALGFPTPNSDFPPQALLALTYTCITFPPQWHQILHPLILKTMVLYETLYRSKVSPGRHNW